MQMASGLLGQNSQANVTGCRCNKTQLRAASLCDPANRAMRAAFASSRSSLPPDVFLQLELIVGCCVLRQAAGITATSAPAFFLSSFFSLPAVDHGSPTAMAHVLKLYLRGGVNIKASILGPHPMERRLSAITHRRGWSRACV